MAELLLAVVSAIYALAFIAASIRCVAQGAVAGLPALGLAGSGHRIVAFEMARRNRTLIRSEPEAVAEVILASPEIRAPHEP